ncbi:MAG: cytochrome c family protein [Gemmataceae bacterium]|nr:cytochrome c family protein [Gemmataceae bacterium]
MVGRVVVFGVMLSGTAGWMLAPGPSGPNEVVAAQDRPKQLTTLYFGVSLCRKCHNEKQPVPDKEALLYRGTEMSTWDQFDKHKDATAVLKNERSQQMAKLLGWPDVRNDRRCLSCHGVVVADEKQVHESSFTPAQREESGVSCVVCHGAVKEWVDNHASVTGAEAWRKLTRADKQRDHGLRDLWDPAVRAELCCSCHIGNAAEGKVVTHEMYAAGHPPLPGFEMVSFSDAMPRHWENLAEKVARRPQHKEFHQRVHGYAADVEDVEAARLLTVSSLTAYRTLLRRTADLARQEASWPELAVFDCAACHHDLSNGAWRQRRPGAGPPGRPMLRGWTTPLLTLSLHRLEALGAADLAKDFRKLDEQLREALGRNPFGASASVAAAADRLAVWAERCRDVLNRPAAISRAAATDMLMALVRQSPGDLLDFDAARQTAWGARGLLTALAPSWRQQPELAKPLEALEQALRLDLPKGQVTIVKEFLPLVLQSSAAHDPERVRKSFDDLAAAVHQHLPR